MEKRIKEMLTIYKDLKKQNGALCKKWDSEFLKGKLEAIDYIIEDLEKLLGDVDD